MATQQNRQQLSLPTGPLGVSIQSRKQTNDADISGLLCVVSAKSNLSTVTTPLEVGDVIVSLNGIKLAEVQGGMDAWVKLFQVFGTGERNLIVQRNTFAESSVHDSTKSAAEKKKHALALKASTKHNSPKKQKLEGAKGKQITAAPGKSMNTSRNDDSTRSKPFFGKRKSETIGSSKNDGANIDSTSKSNVEIISLLDDSDEEDAPSNSNVTSTTELDIMEVSTSSTSASMWRHASSLSTSSTSSEPRGNLKDDRNYIANKSGKAAEEDDDVELAIVGTKGQNALVDFPHSRANCVSHPFATGDKKLHCDNCYCYVCDIPAKDCKSWVSHCEASHDVPHWRAERERAKRQAREPAPASSSSASRAVVVSRSSSTALSTSSASNSNARVTEYSVRSLLQKVTTVHPVEMTPPAGGAFRTSLRHYQKQSLAFMVDTERSLNRGGWLCDEVGMGKSAVVLALVAANPPNPKSLTAKNKIDETVKAIDANEEKRQSIRQAYYNKEASAEKDHEDQIALAESEDEKDKLWDEHYNLLDTLNDGMKDELSEIAPSEKVKLKTTVVLTSVSLMGQWEDEVKKHAPGLVVKTFHNSRKKNNQSISLYNCHDIERLSEVDIIISTSTFSWPYQITKYCEFHRVAQDEAHLFQGRSACVYNANELSSKHRWGVTATPISNSAIDLKKQLDFIQGSAPFSAVSLLTSAITRFNSKPKEAVFNELVDLLKTFMVRHTKNQQINGNEALALPPATTSTIMLRMSQEEDRAFNFINTLPSTFSKHLREGAKTFTTQKSFLPQTSKVLNNGNPKQLMEVYSLKMKRRYIPERLTKIVALRNDLAEHRRSEPNLRAVVFTQFRDIHDACVRGLEKDGFEVYEFTGSSNSVKRDKAIRSFQNIVSRRPAVFVITLRSGNVGITLTAASRVYLLEPCLDPAVEVQAAGRIHRLGQNKSCHVVKLAFKNSYEANIIKLHKQILEGKVSIVDGYVPPGAMKILAEGIRFRPSL